MRTVLVSQSSLNQWIASRQPVKSNSSLVPYCETLRKQDKSFTAKPMEPIAAWLAPANLSPQPSRHPRNLRGWRQRFRRNPRRSPRTIPKAKLQTPGKHQTLSSKAKRRSHILRKVAADKVEARLHAKRQ